MSVAPSLQPFPAHFPHKGKFVTWDRQWNRSGYAAHPQYPGQMAITYPEDATPLECALGGYMR